MFPFYFILTCIVKILNNYGEIKNLYLFNKSTNIKKIKKNLYLKYYLERNNLVRVIGNELHLTGFALLNSVSFVTEKCQSSHRR